MELTLITVNANGLCNVDKRFVLVQWLRSLPTVPDVVSLQECHCVSLEECRSWFRSSGFSSVVSSGSRRSCGCIVLFRNPLLLVNSWTDTDGRFFQCEFFCRNSIFRVACVYAPSRNPERDGFFADVLSRVDPAVATFLWGDFNAVLDRFGSAPDDTLRESSSTLTHLFSSCCVVGIWRQLHPSVPGFTWSRWDGLRSSRIDLIGCPFSWLSAVSSCDIVPCPFSDHSAVLLSSSVPQAVLMGSGLWKLNVSVLEEPDYFRLISDFWSGWRHRIPAFASLSDWWEMGKSRIKGLTINYCCCRSQSKSQERDLLARLASHLKSRLDLGVLSCLEAYKSVLERLAALDLEAAKGAQVPSRIRWIEEGELSSAFFFRLEKKRAADRLIGSVVNSTTGLLEAFSSFYSKLFSAQPCDPHAQ